MAPGVPTSTLKCNKWVLQVPIHCAGCKREIKKILHSIHGVYTTSIDPEQQEVTVTGSIDSDILIKKLLKTGKHAEVCSEKPAEKLKKIEKPSDLKPCQNKDPITTTLDVTKKPNKPESKSPTKNTNEKNSDKKGSDGPGVAEAGNAGEWGKTKKGKGQKSNNCVTDRNSTTLLKADQGRCQGAGIQGNPNPTSEQLESITNGGSSFVQVLSYYAAQPSKPEHGLSYQIPSASAYIEHKNSNADAESYQVETSAFDNFDIFSDENANGCSVM